MRDALLLESKEPCVEGPGLLRQSVRLKSCLMAFSQPVSSVPQPIGVGDGLFLHHTYVYPSKDSVMV